jgi:hypothetical protein
VSFGLLRGPTLGKHNCGIAESLGFSAKKRDAMKQGSVLDA